MALVHSLAVIDETASIGENAQVWQFASIIRGAVIGRDCSIGAGAIVDGATVGRGCRVGANAQLHPGTIVGDNVFIGPGVVFCNDVWPSVDADGFDRDEVVSGGAVRVCDGASIGAGSIILPGVTIGENAFIAAGSVIRRNVCPGVVKGSDDQTGFRPRDWREKRMRHPA